MEHPGQCWAHDTYTKLRGCYYDHYHLVRAGPIPMSVVVPDAPQSELSFFWILNTF